MTNPPIRIQTRRDTAANWASVNPTMGMGEIGYETDTGKFKFGDGVTAWNGLEYAGGGAISGRTTGAETVADGGTIAHGLGASPTTVHATGSIPTEFVAVTAKDATTFTVAIKTNLGEPGTAQTIYWEAIT